MDSRMRMIYASKLNEGFSLKLSEGFPGLTPEKGQRTQWPKHCSNNENENISLNVNNVNQDPGYKPH